MRLHLLYLSEDLAALPLFSEDISNDDKRVTVNALQREPFSDDVRLVEPNKVPVFLNCSIAEFITQWSLNLFESLRLPQDFLATDVDTWTNCADYIAACKIVRALKVVNDCAEKAVKLANDFNEVLTKNNRQ